MMKFFNYVFVIAALISSTVHAETVTYYHTDALGTPVAATDESGNVLWREHYSPFGEKLDNSQASQSNNVGYTGHQFDSDTGLVYMQARYYDPVIGRFYSNDPVGFRDVHSFNRYAYANNNPYKYIDLDGRIASLAFPVIGKSAKQSAELTKAQNEGYVAAGSMAASTLIPGPEDLALAGFLSSKAGQGIKGLMSRLSGTPKLTVNDFADVGSKISQKQLRHIAGRKEYKGGGYLNSSGDAQKVLDSFNSGGANIIGKSKQGFPIVKVNDVFGTHVSTSASGTFKQTTNVFMIKGTKSPSIVPVNPNRKGF